MSSELRWKPRKKNTLGSKVCKQHTQGQVTRPAPHFFMEVMPMKLNPIWERERNRYELVDSITSFGTVFSVPLSIAFQSAFGYCVCCENGAAVPASRKVR